MQGACCPSLPYKSHVWARVKKTGHYRRQARGWRPGASQASTSMIYLARKYGHIHAWSHDDTVTDSNAVQLLFYNAPNDRVKHKRTASGHGLIAHNCSQAKDKTGRHRRAETAPCADYHDSTTHCKLTDSHFQEIATKYGTWRRLSPSAEGVPLGRITAHCR
jgi:hypothetical protein